jgi:hypothetical protein
MVSLPRYISLMGVYLFTICTALQVCSASTRGGKMQIRKPRSWLGPLMLVSVLVMWAGLVMKWTHIPAVRVPGGVIYGTARWMAGPALLAWAVSSASQDLRRKPDGPPHYQRLAQHASLLGFVATGALLFLVTQGDPAALGARGAHVNGNGWLPVMESLVLAYGLLYALLFAPEILRRKLPFERASEQALRLVPAALATVAALVTGSYLLALHCFNEPLARIPLGPLAASILAVMALLTPLYQLIARACWRYGLADLLDPAAWWANWSEVKDEITFYQARNYRSLRKAAQERSAEAEAEDGTESARLKRQAGDSHPERLYLLAGGGRRPRL